MNRQDAIKSGEITYHGIPCNTCAGTERYVSSCSCKPCTVARGFIRGVDEEAMVGYRAKLKTFEHNKQWRAKNPKQAIDPKPHQKNKENIRNKPLSRP